MPKRTLTREGIVEAYNSEWLAEPDNPSRRIRGPKEPVTAEEAVADRKKGEKSEEGATLELIYVLAKMLEENPKVFQEELVPRWVERIKEAQVR